MKTRTTIIAALAASVSVPAMAIEVTEQACLDAITSLDLPSEPYEFKDGWFGDKHVFAGTVECSEKRGELFITQRGTTVVEDGFFGPEVLSARDKALAIQKTKNETLEDERDELIRKARDEYKASSATLDEETELQLQKIRDGGMPDAIVAAIEAERMEREAAAAREAKRKTEREAERAARAVEREAERVAREAEATELKLKRAADRAARATERDTERVAREAQQAIEAAERAAEKEEQERGAKLYAERLAARTAELRLGREAKEKPEREKEERQVAVNAESETPPDFYYEILSDERRGNVKRSVNVRLPERVSEETLRGVAEEIHGSTGFFEKTYVFYLLPNMEPGFGAWATTHYRPDMELSILGATVEQGEEYAASAAEAAAESDAVGSWMDGRIGALMTIFAKDDALYLRSMYPDGSSGEEELISSEVNGGTRYETPDNGHGEFFVLNPAGNLEFWSAGSGNYYTAKPAL